MTPKTDPQPQGWTKPELIKLGKISDVAGGTGLVTQGQPLRS